MNEALHIANASSDFSTSPSTYTVFNDHFNTRNQFYGGQLGTRLSWQRYGFSLDLAGKPYAAVWPFHGAEQPRPLYREPVHGPPLGASARRLPADALDGSVCRL